MDSDRRSKSKQEELKLAYEKLEAELKAKGETLPTDDTGATYYNPTTQKRERILTFNDLERTTSSSPADGSKDTLYEQELKLRDKYAYLSPFEMEIIVHKFIHNRTFEAIQKRIGFETLTGVFRTYKKSLVKIKNRIEKESS